VTRGFRIAGSAARLMQVPKHPCSPYPLRMSSLRRLSGRNDSGARRLPGSAEVTGLIYGDKVPEAASSCCADAVSTASSRLSIAKRVKVRYR